MLIASLIMSHADCLPHHTLIRWDAAVPLTSSELAHTLGYDGYESYLHELAAIEYALPKCCLDQSAPPPACKCSPRRHHFPTGT